MNINWIELLNVLRVWGCNVGLYGLITISVIALLLTIHTRMSKDNGCNIKLLRKILS